MLQRYNKGDKYDCASGGGRYPPPLIDNRIHNTYTVKDHRKWQSITYQQIFSPFEALRKSQGRKNLRKDGFFVLAKSAILAKIKEIGSPREIIFAKYKRTGEKN